jgi:small neutral amino acid transporter SnatA (MarC family)
MMFWVSVAISTMGFVSAVALFYAATDPYGKIPVYNNLNPNLDRDLRRRKLASKAGLLLVAIGFALQLWATVKQG